jgi:hypothetical protein
MGKEQGLSMCTLRICGDDLDVEALVASLDLEMVAAYRRGEPWFKGSTLIRQTSGIHVRVSDAGFGNLPEQITDTCVFIEEHKAELAGVRSFPGVETIEFDFPVEEMDVTIPCYGFPPKLLELLASIGAHLDVSLYPASKPSAESGGNEQ